MLSAYEKKDYSEHNRLVEIERDLNRQELRLMRREAI